MFGVCHQRGLFGKGKFSVSLNETVRVGEIIQMSRLTIEFEEHIKIFSGWLM